MAPLVRRRQVGSTASVDPSRTTGRRLERAWIGWIVFYSVIRFVVAWGGFNEHGANPWVFGVIDIGTAYPYAKSIAVVVRRCAAGQYSKLGLPTLVAVCTFFAPYVYLWFAAGSMPDSMRFGLVAFVAVLVLATATGTYMKIRRLRAAAAAQKVEIDLRAEPAPVLNLTLDSTKTARSVRASEPSPG